MFWQRQTERVKLDRPFDFSVLVRTIRRNEIFSPTVSHVNIIFNVEKKKKELDDVLNNRIPLNSAHDFLRLEKN